MSILNVLKVFCPIAGKIKMINFEFPPSVVESAQKLVNAWLECKTAAEVKQLTAQHEDLKPIAWKLLTEDGRNHIRNLMVEGKGEENAISENESPLPKHVQDVQNGSTTGVTTPSEDIQPPSEHVQKSIKRYKMK
jgi:hypothetical protein